MNINTYKQLLCINYKNNIIASVVAMILFLTILLAYRMQVYDTYTTYATYIDGQLLLSVPVENSDSVNKGKFIMVNDEKYFYSILDVSELLESNFTNYQQYSISINNVKMINNQVIKVTLYYNKERITKKIIKIIF